MIARRLGDDRADVSTAAARCCTARLARTAPCAPFQGAVQARASGRAAIARCWHGRATVGAMARHKRTVLGAPRGSAAGADGWRRGRHAGVHRRVTPEDAPPPFPPPSGAARAALITARFRRRAHPTLCTGASRRGDCASAARCFLTGAAGGRASTVRRYSAERSRHKHDNSSDNSAGAFVRVRWGTVRAKRTGVNWCGRSGPHFKTAAFDRSATPPSVNANDSALSHAQPVRDDPPRFAP